MNNSARFRRVTGISAILLTLFTIGNVITLFMSVNNNAQAFSDMRLLLSVGDRGADLFHWSMVFDIFAYLSFVPIALLCWSWFRSDNKITVLLYTFCGLAYSLLGSTGAAVLGAVVPNLTRAYGLASATQRENMQIVVGGMILMPIWSMWLGIDLLRQPNPVDRVLRGPRPVLIAGDKP